MKILIVDDELPIREWLRFAISKCAPDIELAGVAANGEEALDSFRRTAPQLVLTDIKMPVMSGIELLREIKSIHPSVYVVMLTSHNDFEYARNALTYGADEYILKSEITTETLGKIIQTCQARQNTGCTKEVQGFSIAQTHKDFRSPRELLEQLQAIPAIAPVTSYFVLAIPVTDGICAKTQAAARETARRYGQLSVECHTCGELLFCKAVFPNIPSTLFQMNLYHSFTSDLLRACARNMGSSGIRASGVYRDAALCAGLALNSAFYEESNAPKYYSIEAAVPSGIGERTEGIYRKAVTAILQTDFKHASELIVELMQEIGAKKPLDIPAVKRAVTDILAGYKTAAIGNQFDRLGQICLEVSQQVHETTTFSELRKTIGLFLADASVDSLSVQTAYSAYIQAAILEIQKNYACIQKVSDVSEKLGLNMEYFCRIFKSETGVTFVTYLTEYRLKVAENLLKSTGMKVSEIATAVGYDNLSYFSRLFKRNVGMNPYAYRASTENMEV